MQNIIQPEWPAPSNIKACTTLRIGGVSRPPYHSFNLAEHVGDQAAFVEHNRKLLKTGLNLPSDPIWLKQTHSTITVSASLDAASKEADASFTDQPNVVCAVLTADCLPLLLCDRNATHVAAIHAGWRGLANGIIENTLKTMGLSPKDILAWLGPAIGPTLFEVGDEVRTLFLAENPRAKEAFLPSPNEGRFLANLYLLARLRLHKQGIDEIYGGNHCTYTDKERFFSYRRDSDKTGRMASLIWISTK